MKNYYQCMQIAHMISQLFELSSLFGPLLTGKMTICHLRAYMLGEIRHLNLSLKEPGAISHYETQNSASLRKETPAPEYRDNFSDLRKAVNGNINTDRSEKFPIRKKNQSRIGRKDKHVLPATFFIFYRSVNFVSESLFSIDTKTALYYDSL
ncbi:hypothetical protein QUF80_12245 [Desulfococcaceae bacterium HSG8]|nr:hypothetical protein [Desulfococcaceae bacterium HSG8]